MEKTMGELNANYHEKLRETLADLWSSKGIGRDVPEKCVAEAQSCMQKMVTGNFVTAISFLDQLNNIKTSNDVENFENSIASEASFRTELVQLAKWMVELQNQKTLSVLREKISDTKICFQRALHIFIDPVNDDDFETFSTTVETNPRFNLSEVQANGINLLQLAYLRRSYFNYHADIYEIKEAFEPGTHTTYAEYLREQELLEEKEKSAEHQIENADKQRRKENRKILSFLIRRSDINAVSMDGKTILHFAANKDSPPSDIIYFLFKGADPEKKDKKGKKAFDYCLKQPDQNTYLHNQILSIKIPAIFDPAHYLLLENIMKDKKGQAATLFDELANSWPDVIKNLKSDEQKGMLLYHLYTTNPGAVWTNRGQIAVDKVRYWIGTAASAIYKIDSAGSVKYNEVAAELGSPWATYNLALYYDRVAKKPRNLTKAIELYAKSYPIYKIFAERSPDTKNKIENDSNDVITRLKEITTDKDANSEEKRYAMSELKAIYELRWKNNNPASTYSEKLELLDLYNKLDNKKEKDELLKQISDSFETELNKLPTEIEKGKLLYSLLTHHDPELKNQISTAIEKNNSTLTTKIASNYFNSAGNEINKSDKIMATRYYEFSAEWENQSAMFNLGNNHIHYLPEKEQDLKKAIQLYQRSYTALQEFHRNIIITDLKNLILNTKNKEYRNDAFSALVKIYIIRWTPPEQYISEQIKFIKFFKKIVIEKELREIFYGWINNSIEQILKSDKKDEDKAELLFNLLTPPNSELAKLARAMIVGKKLILLLSIQTKVKLAKLMDKIPDAHQELRKEFSEQIINNLEKALEENFKRNEEKGDFLYTLLVPATEEIAQRVMALIHEKKLAKKLGAYIHAAAAEIKDKTKKLKYYETAVSLGFHVSMWNRALYYHEAGDYANAVELYKKCYPHWTTDKDRQDIVNKFIKIKRESSFHAGDLAIIEIDELHKKALASIKMAIEALPAPANNTNMQSVTLENGKQKMIPPDIAAQLFLINEALETKSKKLDDIINLLHNKKAPEPEFEAYYNIFSEKDMGSIIKKSGDYNKNRLLSNYQKYTSTPMHTWANQPDGIIQLLNSNPDERELRKFERSSAILHWIEQFGNADTFIQIDQERRGLLTHRILERGISPKSGKAESGNMLALDLERQLISLWEKDPSISAKKALHHLYSKKLQFLNKLNPNDTQLQPLKDKLQALSSQLTPPNKKQPKNSFFHRNFSKKTKPDFSEKSKITRTRTQKKS